MQPALALIEDLIRRRSVTSEGKGCQDVLIKRLIAAGFEHETVISGPDHFRVTNLWAIKRGHAGTDNKPLMFVDHTDVVPTGPVEQWHSGPFKSTHRDDKLYACSAADMKTSIASFVVASGEFAAKHPDHADSIGFLITSDEEGPTYDGTVRVCDLLRARGECLDYCVVGEPTSVSALGDMVKNGRCGSLSGKLTVNGVQGHIAYPYLAKNPIHLAAPTLAELAATRQDNGNAYFPPTTWQMSNIHGGTGVMDIIPGHVTIDFNFRFSTTSTPSGLKARVHSVLGAHGLDYTLDQMLGGEPFLTERSKLSDASTSVIQAECGVTTELSTTGGMSNGRFIAKICLQVIEFGPPSTSIHKTDEHVEVAFIEPLKNVYRRVSGILVT